MTRRRCQCGCRRPVEGLSRKRFAGDACRKRAARAARAAVRSNGHADTVPDTVADTSGRAGPRGRDRAVTPSRRSTQRQRAPSRGRSGAAPPLEAVYEPRSAEIFGASL
jgi:hypothetical protein